jgi:hypothetical protein
MVSDSHASHLQWMRYRLAHLMADPLYLSLWFSNFDAVDMLPHALSVMRQFPFSAQRPGVTYLAVHPVSWSEPTVLEQRFRPGASPEEAILLASDLMHDDYAYVFEAFWDLWTPKEQGLQWELQPSPVRFLAHSPEFDEGASREAGHLQIDFGLDTPFLQETVELNGPTEENIRANVQKLVEFVNQIEKTSGATGRLLWSESEENLAQKLLARLQKVQ